MSYKQEQSPIYSALNQSISDRLRVACDKRTAHGIAGIKNWNSLGKPDGTLSFKDFYMHPDLFNLGCAIYDIDVDIWASWLMNSELEISDNHVIIHSPNGLYVEHGKSKLGPQIAKHYGKPCWFRVNHQLGRIMDKL